MQLTDNEITLLKNNFEKLYEIIYKLKSDDCYGCKNNCPSQRDHGCLYLTWSEQLNLYFASALSQLKLINNN